MHLKVCRQLVKYSISWRTHLQAKINIPREPQGHNDVSQACVHDRKNGSVLKFPCVENFKKVTVPHQRSACVV